MEQQYEAVAELGAGVYGAVTTFKARDLLNQGRFVALLEGLRLRTDGGEEEEKTWRLLELRLLTELEHPNVARLLDFRVDAAASLDGGGTRLALVYELVDQDLSTYLGKWHQARPRRIKEVMRQLLYGLHYLHDHSIVHHELTPRSVLVTASGRVKLAGWGVRRFYSTRTAPAVPWYRAPELLLQVTYDPAVDLWSVGCIFAEMFTQRPLFPGGSDLEQLTKMFDLLGVPSQEEWPHGASLPHADFAGQSRHARWALADSVPGIGPDEDDDLAMALMLELLTFNPCKRISASIALCHPYFSEAAVAAPANGVARGEGVAPGEAEGVASGVATDKAEGEAEDVAEGMATGEAEGVASGEAEGVAPGVAEGVATGEGVVTAEGMATGEGVARGKAEGVTTGERVVTGKAESMVTGEGVVTGKAEGVVTGEAEGVVTGKAEGVATG